MFRFKQIIYWRFLLFIVLTVLIAVNCKESSTETKVPVTLPDIDITGSSDGIVPLPDDVDSVFKSVFIKYTKYTAPNGKPIHILAQSGWTDVQIKKARNVLQYILSDFPGSVYGNDKIKIANAMADRKATMVLFSTEEDMRIAMRSSLGRVTDLSMQDLRANECPAEGTEDYMNHITRDAAFEEIWHLVHDYGVKPMLSGMLAEMQKTNDAAEVRGWRGWPDDEPEEHPNEYVGVLLDNYLDLWTVTPKKYEGRILAPGDIPDGTSHFGRYFANSRKNLKKLDTAGYELIEKFFHPYLTYTPELPDTFKGSFSIGFDESLDYTYKSQHLVDVTLAGKNNAGLIGNAHDNILVGNAGDNVLKGGAGNDQLDGGAGNDTVVLSGSFSDYTITKKDGVTTVTDKQAIRDGTDVLKNIEILQFKDRTVRSF